MKALLVRKPLLRNSENLRTQKNLNIIQYFNKRKEKYHPNYAY